MIGEIHGVIQPRIERRVEGGAAAFGKVELDERRPEAMDSRILFIVDLSFVGFKGSDATQTSAVARKAANSVSGKRLVNLM